MNRAPCRFLLEPLVSVPRNPVELSVMAYSYLSRPYVVKSYTELERLGEPPKPQVDAPKTVAELAQRMAEQIRRHKELQLNDKTERRTSFRRGVMSQAGNG